MSSMKRPQEPLDPGAWDIEDDRSGLSSNPHYSKRKRLRTSDSPASYEDTEESDQESGDGNRRSITQALEIDEDELELRATQLIQEKYSFASDEPNVPAEHGILERVECYNFMCHDHFNVELGPLINFIVGKNGSGKSAVLTAIILCLGGKASATNRGQSLKSFIKEGKESATIVVRIKNQGDGAYMPDDYGKSIIVERHFSKNGTSGFKLKAENGRIVSTKKVELDAIIDFFTLQFDNPMNVLSQDMARQFLSSSSPAEKYKFFVKGVQLEQLDQDYRLIEESADQIEEKLKAREQDIGILENRRDAANQKLDISDQHESLRNRVRNVRSQMAWAQVEEQEKILSSLEMELTRADEKIALAEAELGNFDSDIQEAESETGAAAEYVRQATAKVEQAQSEKEEIKVRWEEQMNRRHDLQAEQRQIREYLKASEIRINETQRTIAEESQRLADQSGGSYIRKQEELERARAEAADARTRQEEHQRDADRLRRELEDAEKEVTLLEAPIGRTKADVEQAETLLQTLNNEGGSRNSGFHDKLPALLRAIQQERSFTEKPVGPIGHHVILLKPEWSSILENSLGATLNSFIVTSKKDMNILSNIMHKINCICPIFIGSGGYIDTSGHEPDPQFDTALRVLQIDNELVRRQLIINHGIEQMLLIERLEEASSVLFDGRKPNNVKRCYCIDQTDRRRGVHLSYNRAGEPNQGPVPVYDGSPRMKSDLASQIRIQRGVVVDLRRTLSDQEQQYRSARSRLEGCKQARVRHERKTNDLRIAVQRKEDHVEELTDALDQEPVEGDCLDVLRSTLQEAEEEKRLNEGSLKDSTDAMDAMMRSLKAIKQELASKDAEIATFKEELRVAQSEELIGQDKRRKIITNKNVAIERIDDSKREREKINQKREEVAARVITFSEKASLVSPRVSIPHGETANSLDKKLDRLHKDIQRYNQQLGASRDEIAAEAAKATTAHEQALKQVEEFRLLADILIVTLKQRKRRWGIFRSHISSRAKAQFTYLLSERSFRGRLLTDHEGKLLDLQVEPDITKDSTGRGAKTLSGGEKSFSQVCLLLALWEAMGSPIRCLDEFDVYMDHINRKMAIDMLMLAARRSVGVQFILITPGSRAEISLAPDVRVKELAEPERGQTRLSFRQ
ncbi:P-loop containing nucleoside triphosphate hydrolase protein [Aspergillus leporis]|uniref:P-loop containing nucleoside triphosphate hydrolase protein n=1 Tax=Aspergillus leporis TaxID=41062 RepID=A0A5N5X7G6_9EURO|nr:P-loop containing nucleoside triphosphate hydrolase protein [Aspergillus leporis]